MQWRIHEQRRHVVTGLFLVLILLGVGIGPSGPVRASGYPLDLNWEAVAFGNGTFVAVASSGTGTRVMTSPDGETWTLRQSASDSDWQALTYHNGLFVAVGTNAAMTSTDGVSWNSATVPDGAWDTVVGCNGTFVAAASTGSSFVMSTTTPSASWTLRTPAYGWDHQQLACKPDGSMFVSSSHLGRVWYSSNGTTWSQGSTPIVHIHAKTFAVINGTDTFVWLEYNDFNNNGTQAAISTNGSSFTNQTSNSNIVNPWNFMTYGGSKFVVVADGGQNHRAAYSTDGINWSLGSGLPNNSWQAVAYGNSKYVAVAKDGTGNRVAVSPDGIVWSTISLDASLLTPPADDPDPPLDEPEIETPNTSLTTVAVSSSELADVTTSTSIRKKVANTTSSSNLPKTGRSSHHLLFAAVLLVTGSVSEVVRRRIRSASK